MPDLRDRLRGKIDIEIGDKVLNRQLGIENLKRHSFENFKTGNTKGNSSVLSGSVEDERLNNGRPTLIPFLYKGEILEGKEGGKRAVDLAVNSGKVWPSFDTNEEATEASKAISNRLGRKK